MAAIACWLLRPFLFQRNALAFTLPFGFSRNPDLSYAAFDGFRYGWRAQSFDQEPYNMKLPCKIPIVFGAGVFVGGHRRLVRL